MFKSATEEGPSSKCHVSAGVLPRFIDPEQPPSKKKPFSTIMSQSFTHTVNLILPKEIYEIVQESVDSNFSEMKYSRVIMSLSEILEGEFFNHYIKTGNIMMLSEGRPGIDCKYSLFEGVLRLELPKELYERTGLAGKPIRDSGRKHLKTRYAIDINLRQPSMLHGKKGFERIVWAFKHVLTTSLTWLFHDFHNSEFSPENPDPLTKHHPFREAPAPSITHIKDAKVPSFLTSEATPEDEDWAVEIHEWLSLVALQSPRIEDGDDIDAYLCRYQVPDCEVGKVYDLVSITGTGFLPGLWIRRLFVELCNSRKSFPATKGWFALSAYAFPIEVVDNQDGYTILRLADGEVDDGSKPESLGNYVLWEMADSSIS